MAGSNPFIDANHSQTASFVDCGLSLVRRVTTETERGGDITIDFEAMTALRLMIDD